MKRVTLAMGILDRFVDFNEPDTEKAVKPRAYEIGQLTIAESLGTNFNFDNKLKQNEATFYDDQWSIGLFNSAGVSRNFLSWESYTNLATKTDRPVGLSINFQLSFNKAVMSRSVYNIF